MKVKPLFATLAAYLNALNGKGVHIVTVNPYLAERDAKWMGQIYEYLGLSVGVIIPELNRQQRIDAYQCDIVYGTNNEFGFDYLRDNMVGQFSDRVQRGHAFVIIDEVDSVLISEARTPLIISGPVEGSADIYTNMIKIVGQLTLETEGSPGDFTISEQEKQIHLTENGHSKLEDLLRQANILPSDSNLYDVGNSKLLHYTNACLKALHLFNKDVEYIIKDGIITIIDEHTGRAMIGRRWSDGIHQAIEAKEERKHSCRKPNTGLHNISKLLQNAHNKLSGMTGTADTEAEEFIQIYNLEAIIIPTNRPMQRKHLGDRVYLNQQDKYKAIVEDIKLRRKTGQPILVGTCSVARSSEHLSALLTTENITHNVLNAKHHQKEAEIIAQAGCKAH